MKCMSLRLPVILGLIGSLVGYSIHATPSFNAVPGTTVWNLVGQVGTEVGGDFDQTWTMLRECIDTKVCDVEGSFQETWTMIQNETNLVVNVANAVNSLTDIVNGDFDQTWTMIQALSACNCVCIKQADIDALASFGYPYTISQPGCYTLGSDLQVPNNDAFCQIISINANDVRLDLAGHTLINGGIEVASGSNVAIVNGAIMLAQCDAIRARDGVSCLTVENITVDSATGYGLFVGAVDCVNVRNSIFNLGRGGVVAQGATHVTIKNCQAHNNALNGFTSNYITATPGESCLSIDECLACDNGQDGFSFINTGSAVMTNSVSKNNTRDGIALRTADTVEVIGNISSGNRRHGLFVAADTVDCTIMSNKMSANGVANFALDNAGNALVNNLAYSPLAANYAGAAIFGVGIIATGSMSTGFTTPPTYWQNVDMIN
jgi:hypothetical protein